MDILQHNLAYISNHITNLDQIISFCASKLILSNDDVGKINDDKTWESISNILLSKKDLITVDTLVELFALSHNSHILFKLKNKDDSLIFDKSTPSVVKIFSTLGRVNNFWQVPQKNQFFSRPLEILSKISTSFSKTLISVLTGVSGIGKTTTAIEYAYFARDQYPGGIFWFYSRIPEKLLKQYLKLSKDLNVPNNPQDIKAWFENPENKGWLIIYDNIENEEKLGDFILPQSGGHILITSTKEKWPGHLEMIKLDIFTPDEVLNFSKSVLGPDVNVQQISELSSVLQHLPLALNHAMYYLKVSKMDISQYIKEIQAIEGDISANFKTLKITVDKIGKENQLAHEFLGICGYCREPDYIYANSLWVYLLYKFKDEKKKFDQIQQILEKYSLAKFDGSLIKIHRGVQTFMKFQDKNYENMTLFIELVGIFKFYGQMNCNIQAEELKCIIENCESHHNYHLHKLLDYIFSSDLELSGDLQNLLEENRCKMETQFGKMSEEYCYSLLFINLFHLRKCSRECASDEAKAQAIKLAYENSNEALKIAENLGKYCRHLIGDIYCHMFVIDHECYIVDKALDIYLDLGIHYIWEFIRFFCDLEFKIHWKETFQFKKCYDYMENYLTNYSLRVHEVTNTKFLTRSELLKCITSHKLFSPNLLWFYCTFINIGDYKRSIQFLDYFINVKHVNISQFTKLRSSLQKEQEECEADIKAIGVPPLAASDPELLQNFMKKAKIYEKFRVHLKSIEMWENALKIKEKIFQDEQNDDIVNSIFELSVLHFVIGDLQKSIFYAEKLNIIELKLCPEKGIENFYTKALLTILYKVGGDLKLFTEENSKFQDMKSYIESDYKIFLGAFDWDINTQVQVNRYHFNELVYEVYKIRYIKRKLYELEGKFEILNYTDWNEKEMKEKLKIYSEEKWIEEVFDPNYSGDIDFKKYRTN